MGFHITSLCLNSRYRLRTQMMLAFGSTAVIALTAFTLIGLYTAYSSGQSVQNQARTVVEELIQGSLSSTAEYVAQTVTKKFNNIGGAGSLMAQATRDRFVGYPSLRGWEDDHHVPFPDILSGRNVFPLDATELPLDWEINMNFDASNADEHLPRRPLAWYSPDRTKVSTENAQYFMQGACDPSVTDPTAPDYYPNCTAANNDVYTGGVVRPTATNFFIWDKAKDLAWLFKALYEIHTDVKQMGVFFANGGAGSVAQYPGNVYDGNGTYTSIGCDWMYTTHPRSGKFIASLSDINNCHRRGQVAPMREYSPIERGWCRDQVERDMNLASGQASPTSSNIKSTGPYLDALSSERLWVLTFGEAVFDKITDEFIGCTLVDVSILKLYDILVASSFVGDTSEAALIRWDDRGTVLVASQWNPLVEDDNAYLTDADSDLNMGVDAKTYNEIRSMIDYSQPWDPEEVKAAYRDTVFQSKGKLIMMYPVPLVPNVYDPVYEPEYMVIITVGTDEAFGLLDGMDAIIEADVREIWERIGTIVGIGFGVVVFSILYISLTLVKPLRWMQKVAGMIISNAGNAGGGDLRQGLLAELDSQDAMQRCAPRTEVTKLTRAFESMIREFSGEGAADVAGQAVNEVRNTFEWRRMYEDIYPWETADENGGKLPGTNIPRQLSITNTTVTKEDFEDELTTDSTMRTQASFLSSIRSAISDSKLSPTLETAISKGGAILSSVRESVVLVGTKYGVIKEVEEEVVDAPPRVNRGENIANEKEDDIDDFFDGVTAGEHSWLFWWTTLLVGTPILVTAVLVSISVALDTTELVPVWLEDVKERSFVIEFEAIVTANIARAFFGDEVMARFVRDLHVYSRLAGWLLFGGVARANSFTNAFSGCSLCKNYEREKDGGTCPFFDNPNNTVCDCEWEDSRDLPCTNFPNELFPTTTNTRPFQQRFMEGQRDDIDANGTRMSSSFPSVSVHPSASQWWSLDQDVIEEMPGFSKGSDASGYSTTYDRVRVSSAMGPAEFAIFNYNAGIGEQPLIGSFIGFESDGMMTGYGGCSHGHAEYAHWQANADAEALRPTLCQEGKYGYDARCRPWYDEGMKKGGTHITAPYSFVNSDVFAGSATFSLIDQTTGDFVGQTLIDFLPDAFMVALREENTQIGHGTSGFPIVITPTVGSSGGDTLIGPGFTMQAPSPIGAIVLPFDEEGSDNRIAFEKNVRDRMRAGEQGNATFTRSKNEKGDEELVSMAFAPVTAWTLEPVNSSDFSQGAIGKSTLVYSVGFGITVLDLQLPFKEVEDEVTTDITRGNYISFTLIIAAFLGVIYMTYTMCLYISQPILVLISIVKSIESKQLQDELPKLDGGSCEIYDVYDSLEKLCKIVRFSNAAFFKGDRARSYRVLEEALELFVNMGNQKALGVANNNLGTMVLQEQMEKSSATANSEEVFLAGMKYFQEAIRIGTFEYQNSDASDRGQYIKQLANRYFNRGMFYIVNRNHPMAQGDMENIGIKDLTRAKTLDDEARHYWRDRMLLVTQARSEFGCLMRRARGILTLVQESGFRDVWPGGGVEDLILQAEEMIRSPEYAESNLFDGVNFVARKQQVMDLRMQLALSKGDTYSAAKIAIKLLVEDEYIIDTVIMNCVTTLNKYYDIPAGDPMQVPNLAQGVKRETRRGAVDSMREAKNVIFCLDYSGSMAGARIDRASKNLLWVYEEHCLDKDHVGFVRFNHAVDDKLYFDLGRKGEFQDKHEKILRQATDAEGGTRLYAALHRCVTMAKSANNKYDTWIIALTDGESSWDFPAKQVISQIEKHNKESGSKIHVVVIGFEVGTEVAESVQVITKITDKSLYIDARGGGLDEMDNAFEQVAAVITGNAITMETF